MTVSEVLVVLRTYPAFDIEKSDGTPLRRQVKWGQDTPELLQSYVRMYGQIKIVPKRKQGSAFVRDTGSIMDVGNAQVVPYPLGSVDSGFIGGPSSGGTDVYRIMWENERENAREYREKYEKTLEELRKLEVEHAASKNSAVGDIVAGLAGVVPSLMGLDGGALGTTAGKPQGAGQSLQPVKDNRLQAIVMYYTKLDENQKSKVYNLLAKVFQNINSIDSILEQME